MLYWMTPYVLSGIIVNISTFHNATLSLAGGTEVENVSSTLSLSARRCSQKHKIGRLVL